MELTLLPGSFAVCRLAPDAVLPAPSGHSLWSVTRTADEISVVCEDREAPTGSRIEPGWAALRVEGPIAFTEIGVVAGISTRLAEAGVSIFVVSTFDTDYVLVKHERLRDAIAALESAGYRIANP